MPAKRKVRQRNLKQATLFDIVPSPSPPRATTSKATISTRTYLDNSNSDDAKRSTTASSASEEVLNHSVKRRRKTLRVCSDNSGEEEIRPIRPILRRLVAQRDLSDDEKPTVDKARSRTRRKGRILRQRNAWVISGEEDDDIADEVEQDRILKTRLRVRDKKTAFQKNLEKLKRRKQGKPIESSSSEDDDDGSDIQERGSDAPFQRSKPQSDYDSLFDENSEDGRSSDFIVEDGNAAPMALPAQFSMESRQDLSHQFKKIFQFFVHVAVRPAIERHEFMKQQIRDEEYFSVPLQVTRRKISGLRDSLVASSVWRPDFKNLLEKHPDFDLIPLNFATPSCDACHLSGRLSTLTGRLSGSPYDKFGFESIIESDPDSESDNESEPIAIDFHLGRFCGKRTQVFHDFSHWEYSLFNCIRQEVDELHTSDQSGGFVRIAYAGGKRPPKDLGDADGICDWLDERKIIDMEWQKITAMMESARHLEMARKRGDDD
ncbi:hypothetical protein BDZ94DRAFT_1255770 [Collybia nuda]|uniref:DUF4211 domain-containing protein n=1 Tax=Collybia nuda TaxID=64659 RepID=A0A9P5Y9P9_9AGAR|nr:hypothetical protein BDZ94DRAFT_1255770 [Collybia nuda]